MNDVDDRPTRGPGTEQQIMPYKDDAARRAYDADYKRLRRSGGPTLSNPLVPPEVRLQTARDVLDLFARQVDAVQADPDADVMDRARTVGFLASIALRAIEAGDQAARIEALERALKLRAEDQKKATVAAAAAKQGRSNGHGGQ
jgi:hypothetical protein